MMRKPTPRHLKLLRGMLTAAGGDEMELRRWIKQAATVPKGKSGPRRKNERMLVGLEMFCQIAAREREMSRTQAVRWLVNSMPESVVPALGTSRDSTTALLLRKLQEPSIKQRVRRAKARLKARGVDPARFTFEAL